MVQSSRNIPRRYAQAYQKVGFSRLPCRAVLNLPFLLNAAVASAYDSILSMEPFIELRFHLQVH